MIPPCEAAPATPPPEMATPPVDALAHFEAQEAYKMQMKALQVRMAPSLTCDPSSMAALP